MGYFKTLNLKQIFLVDAIGALLTAFFLFAILAQLEHYFGMPKQVLFLLSGIAFCLFIYSMCCHRFIKSNWKPFLIALMIFNTAYLLVSITMVIQNAEYLTNLGWIYFTLEILIIGILISIEYTTYSSQVQKR